MLTGSTASAGHLSQRVSDSPTVLDSETPVGGTNISSNTLLPDLSPGSTSPPSPPPHGSVLKKYSTGTQSCCPANTRGFIYNHPKLISQIHEGEWLYIRLPQKSLAGDPRQYAAECMGRGALQASTCLHPLHLSGPQGTEVSDNLP